MSAEDKDDTEFMEKACIEFFKAIMRAGQEILGHTEFQFRIDCMMAVKKQDHERVQLVNAKVQKALDLAKTVTTPKTINGASLQ